MSRDYFRKLNKYTYCANDPISKVDPEGLDWFDCFAECIEDNDPLDLLWSKIISGIIVGSIHKKWAAKIALALGDEELARALLASRRLKKNVDKFTNLMTILRSKILGRDPTSKLKTLGAVANGVYVAYGLYLAALIDECAAYCVCLDYYKKSPGIALNPLKWVIETVAEFFSNFPTGDDDPPGEALPPEPPVGPPPPGWPSDQPPPAINPIYVPPPEDPNPVVA